MSAERDEIARIIATKCGLLETRFAVDLSDPSWRGPSRSYPNWQAENAADALLKRFVVAPRSSESGDAK